MTIYCEYGDQCIDGKKSSIKIERIGNVGENGANYEGHYSLAIDPFYTCTAIEMLKTINHPRTGYNEVPQKAIDALLKDCKKEVKIKPLVWHEKHCDNFLYYIYVSSVILNVEIHYRYENTNNGDYFPTSFECYLDDDLWFECHDREEAINKVEKYYRSLIVSKIDFIGD